MLQEEVAEFGAVESDFALIALSTGLGCTTDGFDHGTGHPLLFLDDAKAPNCQNNNYLKDLGNYFEWPKVAGAVINVRPTIVACVPCIVAPRLT